MNAMETNGEEHVMYPLAKIQSMTDGCDRVNLGGQKYAVSEDGNYLFPLFSPDHQFVRWNNDVYTRTKYGIFRRDTAAEIQPHLAATKNCRFFTRLGNCLKGHMCPFEHKPERVALCLKYMSGLCRNAQCLFNHLPSRFNTPLCRHALAGSCTDSECRFRHTRAPASNVHVSVCRPFAVAGFCIRGLKCPFMHLLQCPDFEESGKCSRSGCRLQHVISLHTQQLRSIEDNVLVETDQVTFVSSYTVLPAQLLARDAEDNHVIHFDYD